jgi:hypothetical protein
MGALRLKLFNDITNRKLVVSPVKADGFPCPTVFQEDKINFEITFLEINPDGSYNAPFSILDPTGFSLTVKVGTITGSAILAATSAFTAGVSSLTGVLDLNTAEMVSAINAAGTANKITPVIEFELNDGACKITTYQQLITVNAELIKSGQPAGPLPITAYPTWDELTQRFVQFGLNPPGRNPIFVSPNGAHTREVGVDNSGDSIDNPS